jgi:hypothetical protein
MKSMNGIGLSSVALRLHASLDYVPIIPSPVGEINHYFQ